MQERYKDAEIIIVKASEIAKEYKFKFLDGAIRLI